MNRAQTILTVIGLALFAFFGVAFFAQARFMGLRGLVIAWFVLVVVYVGLFRFTKK